MLIRSNQIKKKQKQCQKIKKKNHNTSEKKRKFLCQSHGGGMSNEKFSLIFFLNTKNNFTKLL